jgi:signal recognition particle subunit SRP19
MLQLQAVENPNYQEIRDVIASAGFVVGVENKKYCRERSNEPMVRGRIRVHFKNDDGSLINPKFPSRKLLYRTKTLHGSCRSANCKQN